MVFNAKSLMTEESDIEKCPGVNKKEEFIHF